MDIYNAILRHKEALQEEEAWNCRSARHRKTIASCKTVT